MDELKRLLGLPPTASDDAVVERVRGLVGEHADRRVEDTCQALVRCGLLAPAAADWWAAQLREDFEVAFTVLWEQVCPAAQIVVRRGGQG